MNPTDKRSRRARRKFPQGQRVMGKPGQFGKVIGHDGTRVEVWWDSGTTSLCSITYLSLVKKSSI